MMDAQQSQQLFQQADALFRSGNYTESLKILNQLNSVFPNRQDVMFPALLCLEKLGKTQEALGLADQLIRNFKDPRAQKVRDRIAPANPYAVPGLDDIPMPTAAAVGGIDLNSNALADLLGDDDTGSSRATPPPLPRRTAAQAGRREIMMLVGIAIAALVFSGMLNTLLQKQVVGYINKNSAVMYDEYGQIRQFESVDEEELAYQQMGEAFIEGGIPVGLMLLFCITWWFQSVMCSIPAGWVALRVFNNLPNDDFAEDIKDIAIYSCLCMGIVVFLPLLGFGILNVANVVVIVSLLFGLFLFLAGIVISEVIVTKHYELSCGVFFLSEALWLVSYVAASIVIGILLLPFSLIWGTIL